MKYLTKIRKTPIPLFESGIVHEFRLSKAENVGGNQDAQKVSIAAGVHFSVRHQLVVLFHRR